MVLLVEDIGAIGGGGHWRYYWWRMYKRLGNRDWVEEVQSQVSDDRCFLRADEQKVSIKLFITLFIGTDRCCGTRADLDYSTWGRAIIQELYL